MQRSSIISESKINITCIRHCQDGWDYHRLLEGPLDEGLTKMGRQRAGEVASFIKHTLPNDGRTKMICSTSKKAVETAQIIEKETGISAKQMDGLKGRHYGDYRLLVDPCQAESNDYRSLMLQTPPDAENQEDFENRVYANFCSILKDCNQTTNLILVIHHGIFKYLANLLTGKKDQTLLEGEGCRFVNQDGQWSLESLIIPKSTLSRHGIFSGNKQLSLSTKQPIRPSLSCHDNAI